MKIAIVKLSALGDIVHAMVVLQFIPTQHGITRESFPQGTVMSMGIHPRRDGRPAGDRGDSGLFQCPKGISPEPGKHCDSVPGNISFGPGEIPAE